MKIGVGQLCSTSNVLRNAKIVTKLIKEAVEQNVEILFLPEATDYILKNAEESLKLAKQSDEFIGIIQKELKKLKTPLYVSVGIHQSSSNRVLNSLLFLNSSSILQTYNKVHLFDINIPNGPILQESKLVEPGTSILKPFFLNPLPLKIGAAICYDIRFPDMATSLRKLGADIITYPSAFTVKTGEAHWKVLGQARAIETQTFVVMAAQCGKHDQEGKRLSYGHSLIISPWGDILAEGKKYNDELTVDSDGDYYELISTELDEELLKKVKINMPILDHRREDVYNAVK